MSNRTLSCRHTDYFRLPLNGLAPVAHALIRAKPRLSCHASTLPAAVAKQRPKRLGAKPHQANYSTPYDRNKRMTHDIYIYIHICICH
jgi:hypothetical protein